MSLVVLGASHRSAPLDLLERLTLSAEQRAGLVRDLPDDAVGGHHGVREAVVVSTCNRVEVLAEVDAFHSGLERLTRALAEATGVPLADLRDHLYVHFEDRAVAHAFAVAGGLDSLAVGETQILGQLREALGLAQQAGSAGPALNGLLQRALRVGKRVHTETPLDAVSRSLVSTGLDLAAAHVGALAARRVVVVGAGVLSGLVAAELRRRGADLVVVNRTRERAERLATRYDGHAAAWESLAQHVADADLVVSGTGADGFVLTPGLVGPLSRPLALLDLAMPRDVDPALAQRDGVRVIALETLAAELAPAGATGDHLVAHPAVRAAQALVTAEVAEYLTQRAADAATPVVVELRERANVAASRELERLWQRLPGLDERERDEVRRSVQRLVDKLLHTPSVRVRQLAGQAGPDAAGRGEDYTHALRELFDLGGADVASVSRPPVVPDLRSIPSAERGEETR